MAKAEAEILGGFVIRPVRLTDGETIERSQLSYRKVGFGMLDVPGTLHLTSQRLAWTTLWFVKTFRRDDISEVSLHRKWGLGPFSHWSLRLKTRSGAEFFRLRNLPDGLSLWNRHRQKEGAHRWTELVKHWARASVTD